MKFHILLFALVVFFNCSFQLFADSMVKTAEKVSNIRHESKKPPNQSIQTAILNMHATDCEWRDIHIGEKNILRKLIIYSLDVLTIKITGYSGLNNDGIFKLIGMEGISDSLPLIIEGGDSVALECEFSPESSGIIYTDTIFFQTNAKGQKTYSLLNGKAIKPGIIDVSDIEWKDMPVKHINAKDFTIQNKDDKFLLVVTGYTGPSDSTIFQIVGLEGISKATPLVVGPGTSYTFRCRFHPQNPIYYKDSIIFHSNANEKDSICYLTGNGADQPVINVTDIHYADVQLGTTEIKDFFIYNMNNEIELVITGFTGPIEDSIFQTMGLWEVISEANPLIIKPVSMMSFSCKFSPQEAIDYTDTIFFHCNAKEIRNYCALKGNGVDTLQTVLDEPFDNAFKLYPVPARDEIVLENLGDLLIKKAVITNINGAVVKEVRPEEFLGRSELKINLNGVPSGVYFLRISSPKGDYIKEFSILR